MMARYAWSLALPPPTVDLLVAQLAEGFHELANARLEDFSFELPEPRITKRLVIHRRLRGRRRIPPCPGWLWGQSFLTPFEGIQVTVREIRKRAAADVTLRATLGRKSTFDERQLP